MAKDTRNIARTVRVNTTTYGPGQEEELQAALAPEQLAHYLANGSIVGDWGISEGEVKHLTIAHLKPAPPAPGADPLEGIATQIREALGIDHDEADTPLQFLNQFAAEAKEVVEGINERGRVATEAADAAKVAVDAANGERDSAITERDSAITERDSAIAKRDELQAQVDTLTNRVAELEAATKTAKK